MLLLTSYRYVLLVHISVIILDSLFTHSFCELMLCNLPVSVCLLAQTQWAPITDGNETCTAINSSPDVVLPDVNNTTPTLTTDTLTSCSAVATINTSPRCAPTPVQQRSNPLPVFEWADSRQMWVTMMSKEELPGYHRDTSWFTRHSLLQPRTRTVLLDWLMEVILSTVEKFVIKLCCLLD